MQHEPQSTVRTVRRAGEQRGQCGELVLRELFRVFVPGVLMRFPERARALPDGRGDGDL